MKLVDKIENVVHYEVYDDYVLIGRDTRIKNGMISRGNQIIRKSEIGIETLRDSEYFYFTAFKEGVLYYAKEGEPIYYSNGKDTLKVSPKKHYFNPIHNFNNNQEIIITEMDEQFNQKHYFLDSIDFDKRRECKVYPQIRNNKHYCRFHKKESWIEIVNKESEKSYRKIDIRINDIEMDKREKPILDSNNIFIPLSYGKVAMFNCNSDSVQWVNEEFDEQYVSYNTNTEYLYQHFGRGINQISKATGKRVNQINFANAINEKYHSSGSIWCSDDYIITKDLQSGKFCVLSAENLKPLSLEFVLKYGFAESPITFQIMGNRIYVLGKDNVLREYQMN